MADDKDISKGEAVSTAVEVGIALASAEPVFAAAAVLATKAASWIPRIIPARAEVWWRGFLTECKRDGLELDAIQAKISKEVEINSKAADVIMGHMRDVLDTSTTDAVAILGALRGAYYRDGAPPDAFFRCAAELLMQCTEQDISELRALTGRLSCVTSTTRSRTLGVRAIALGNSGTRVHRLAQIEMDESPTRRQDILGVSWDPGPLWKRLPHLLVSTGFARADGQPYDFFVEYEDMRRLHGFLRKRGIRDGQYRWLRSGRTHEHCATLEAIPTCFGYGRTPDEALASLRRNLKLFVDDAETANLVQVQQPT